MTETGARHGCTVPDCDYLAFPHTAKCFAHSRGLKPVFTLAEYLEHNRFAKPWERRNSAGEYTDAAKRLRVEMRLDGGVA